MCEVSSSASTQGSASFSSGSDALPDCNDTSSISAGTDGSSEACSLFKLGDVLRRFFGGHEH